TFKRKAFHALSARDALHYLELGDFLSQSSLLPCLSSSWLGRRSSTKKLRFKL
ncbi:hypothetical protein S245_052334, partial [Arachis hypogaea]